MYAVWRKVILYIIIRIYSKYEGKSPLEIYIKI